MTSQNSDVSARLRNPRAKGSEQLFRQGAMASRTESVQHRVSDAVEMCRALKDEEDLQPSCHSPWELLSGVLAPWVNRANFGGALRTGNALLVPTLLDLP